jgi:hypothetical protein
MSGWASAHINVKHETQLVKEEKRKVMAQIEIQI